MVQGVGDGVSVPVRAPVDQFRFWNRETNAKASPTGFQSGKLPLQYLDVSAI